MAYSLYNWRFDLLIPFTSFPAFHTLPSSESLFVLCNWESLFIFLCLLVLFFGFYMSVRSYVILWFFSLSIIPSRCIHVVVNGKISSFYGWVIFHCVYVHVFSLSIHPSIDVSNVGCLHIFITINVAVNIGSAYIFSS